MGWHKDSLTSKVGIFGKIKAWASAIEEQGRTTLHGHTQLWVQNFYLLQQQLFSTDIKNYKELKYFSSFLLSKNIL